MPPYLKTESLSHDRQRWIAEQLMLEVSPEEVLTQLLQEGEDPTLLKQAIDTAQSHPYIMAGIALARQLKKRDWLLGMFQDTRAKTPHHQAIDRVENLSREEFYHHYYSVGRPVHIIDALQDWTILDSWSPETFKAQYGDQKVEVDTHRNTKRIQEVMRFGDFIDQVTTGGESNDIYITGYNSNFNTISLQALYHQIEPLPNYLDPDSDESQGYFWFGPAGTRTWLHHDMVNGLFCQVYGKKRIHLIAPVYLPQMYHGKNFFSKVDLEAFDPDQFPLFQEVQIHEITLEPGQALFIPVGWWHHVRALEISINLTFNNFYADNTYTSFYDRYGQHPNIKD